MGNKFKDFWEIGEKQIPFNWPQVFAPNLLRPINGNWPQKQVFGGRNALLGIGGIGHKQGIGSQSNQVKVCPRQPCFLEAKHSPCCSNEQVGHSFDW